MDYVFFIIDDVIADFILFHLGLYGAAISSKSMVLLVAED
jgi:hypothetical protein